MSLSTSVIPLILLCILGRIVYQYFSRKVCIKRRKAYIDAFLLPNRVARKLKERYPHLDERNISDVFRELKEYFHIIRESKENGNEAFLSMPSQIVDGAWHEFILCTREYAECCQRAFGRFLHHTPAESMRNPAQMQEGLERTWRVACNREGIKPNDAAALPRLFALDAVLEIPDCHHYVLNREARAGSALVPVAPRDVTLDSEKKIHHASHIGCSAGCGGCGGGCGGCGG
ncbi:MAG: glycine-rich domain-containing protein [Gammaproteobacteria bacterium]